MEKDYIFEYSKNGEHNIVWEAIENLKTHKQIEDFFRQYIKYLKNSNPKDIFFVKIALENINYVLDILGDRRLKNFWEKSLKHYFDYIKYNNEEID